MKINVFYKTEVKPYYRKTSALKKAAQEALGALSKKKGELNIIAVSPSEILKINKRFLGHSYVTDVITFSYPFENKEGAPLGDVYVCFEQTKKQAAQEGHGALLEFFVVCVHGVLHLAGYDDKTKEARAKMNARAKQISLKVLKN